MALELGTAYVTLLPSTKGFGAKLSSQVNREVQASGTDQGARFGRTFNDSASKGLRGLPAILSRSSAPAGAAATKAGAGVGKRFGQGFGSSAKAFLGGAMVGIGAILTSKVAGLVKDAVSAASEMEQSQGAVTAVFKKNAGQIEKSAAGAAQALGLSANAYRELAAGLGSQLKNKGLKDYAAQTEKLVGLGADLSAMFGGTTKEAVGALNSALRGETDPIERYGVSMNQAAIAAEAMRIGLVKTSVDQAKVSAAQLRTEVAQRKYNAAVKEHGVNSNQAKLAQVGLITAQGGLTKALGGTKVELTDQQKAQASLSLITRQTADAQGAFARESDTLAGKQARASASVENLKAAVGEELLPVFADVTDYINTKIVPAVSDFIDEFKNGEGAGGTFKDVLQTVWDILQKVWDAVKLLSTDLAPLTLAVLAGVSAWKTYTTFANLARAAQIALNASMKANVIGLIVTALVGLGIWLYNTYQSNEEFRQKVDEVWNTIKSVIGTVWDWLVDVFNNLKTWFTVTLPNAVNTVRDKIVGAFNAVKSGLGSAFNWVKKNVFDRFVAAFKFIIGKANDFAEGIAKAFRAVARGIHTSVNWLLDKALGPLANAWNTIADKVGMGDKKMSVPQLPPLPEGWATGGWTGPGAKYQPAGIVHADEYVLRKEATNRLRQTIGLQGLDYMNRTGQMPPGYAKGGMVYQQMQSWLRGALPWARVTSSYRPGSITSSGNRSNHSMGRALDLVPSGKGTLMGIFNFLASKFPGAAELIYTPAGRRQIKNGRNMVYGGRVAADHYDHVHWAMKAMTGAASGGGVDLGVLSGLLPPGVAAAIAMSQIGYKAMLGKLNAASPRAKGFNAMGAKQTDTLSTALNAKMAELSASVDYGPGDHTSASAAGGGVERWRSTVLQALNIMGLPASYADITLRRMQQESGGNPRAVNNWDSNAKRGTPSKGLMQVIDPTYRAAAHPLYNRGPFDPLSNILASMRYALRTYGSLPRAYGRPGGYATGGLVTPQLYDTGGILSPGLTLVANNTGKPETVRTYAQEADLQQRLGSDRVQITLNGVKYDTAGEVARELDFAMARVSARRR